MEFRGFFKNTSMKRGDQMKVEVTRQNKMQRAKSRHEMRQTFRNMGCDSEGENEMPPVEETYDDFLLQQQQQQQHRQHRQQSTKMSETMTIKNKTLSQEERFQIRLMRLQEFRERKRRMLLEQRSKQTVPFVPFVCKEVIVSEPKGVKSVEGARKKPTPLGEWQEQQANQIPARTNKTPVMVNKCIKPRVDCWRTEKLPRKATDSEPRPPKPVSVKKAVPIKSVERPTVPKLAVKQRAMETQRPAAVVQPVKHVRPTVNARPAAAVRPLSQKKKEFEFKLKPPSVSDSGSSSTKIVTSTVRKDRKPLTFSFEHTSEIKKQKATLTVNRPDELFDGISPIEVESYPLKPAATKAHGVKHSSPTVQAVAVRKEDSFWEPQPVACLSVYESTVLENGHSVAAIVDETKSKRDCSISDWVPAAVHEITSDSIVIVEDDDDYEDEVFEEVPHITSNIGQEERKEKPAMNESFTITKPALNESFTITKPALNESFTMSVGSVPSDDLHTSIPSEPTVISLASEQTVQRNGTVSSERLVESEQEQPIPERRKSSPKKSKIRPTNGKVSFELNEPDTEQLIPERRKNSPKENKLNGSSKGRVSAEPSNESEIKQPIPERRKSTPKESKIRPTNGKVSFELNEPEIEQSIQERRISSPKESKRNGSPARKRASLIFTEEPIDCEIVPSKSNLTLAEKLRASLDGGKSSSTNSSSSCLSVPTQSSLDDPEDTTPPKEVAEKTRYYYDKVDSELARLQTLCDEYAPFLVDEQQELNDHCRGLIIAAQGQTNILIKKKLTKFRELIGHYETKWNDRKVRHDDLDGFWVMLSLDLDNLDKRFEELRTLKANNWQELVPEEPKVKKLQGGGGVRKREKKPTAATNAKKSSGIADLIRKARQAKQKTTIADLDVLKETVTVVTTPIKRAVRFAASPRRTSLQKRSSLCAGCTPTTVHWDQESKTNPSKRHTIFPEITQSKPDLVKSILKPAKVSRTRRAKSVLFLDDGLDTPQTRRRHSSRTIVDTPKPKIKFNEELEIEHIDNLAARTPSRLELEIQKRRQQSLLGSASLFLPSSDDNDKDAEQQKKKTRKTYAQGTPRRDSGSVRRSSRRASRCIAALFDDETSNNSNDCNAENEQKGSAKRSTRASKNARKKILDD